MIIKGNEVRVVELLTEAEVAEALGIRPRTLRRCRQSGEIAFVQFGRSIRYTTAEVNEFVNRATVANDCRPTRSTQRTSTRTTANIIPFSML